MTSPQMSQGYLTGICTKETVKHTGLNVWARGCGDNGPGVESISAEEKRPTKRPRFEFLSGRQNHEQAEGRSNVTSTGSGDAEILWLRDLLPDLIPNARVASYSYKSDWRKADVETSLRKCGEQLLNILHQDRQSKKGSQRPLIFIGHSLGGLVIKQALVLANHGDEFKDLRLSTAGIIFLGTPHQGSEVAVYGVWLARALGHDKTLLESLRKNSPILYNVARDFETSYSNADIVCYYENEDASYGPLQIQFARYQSAALLGRRAIYLATDHSGLNKFGGPEDENFLLVLPEIQRMVQAAPQKIEERYRAQVANTGNHSFHVDFSLRGIPVVERFVGRDEEMARTAEVLLPTSTDQMRRKVFIIHGLGGVGKTQLSVEYTRKHHKSYSAVFWIDSSTKDRVKRSIADLASRLPPHQLSEKARQYLENMSSGIDEAVEGVLNWFSQLSNDQWLLVFDNVDREHAVPLTSIEAFNVEAYFPTADHGSILITSRLAGLWESGAKDLKLRPVDQIQGKTILENSSGRSEEGSLDLVARLQGLPLALNHAGSYMRKTNTTVSEYTELYEQEWSRLMARQYSSALRQNTDRSILTTWTLSFNSLRSQSDAAANLLMLCSFLDRHDLWYELFKPILDEVPIVDELPSWLVDCVGNKLDFQERMGLLLEYSFIDANKESNNGSSSFSIHSVLHDWCYHQCEEAMASMGRLAVMIVASAAASWHEIFVEGRRLLSHCDRVCSTLKRVLEEVVQNGKEPVSLGLACLTVRKLYLMHGKVEGADKICQLALNGHEVLLGFYRNPMRYLAELSGLVYGEQGKLKEAEQSLLRALEGYEIYKGPNCAVSHYLLVLLGALYSEQGKMKEAENMYLRSLTANEKMFGLIDSSTLYTVHHLGFFYLNQGRTKEAEDLYLRALTGLEKASSPDPELLAMITSDVGSLYSKDRRKIKEAEDMYLRALATYEKMHGAEHINVVRMKYRLGHLYSKELSRMNDAEDMLLGALDGFRKCYGSEHEFVVRMRVALGVLYHSQDRWEEAEGMYLAALDGFQHCLLHEDVLSTRHLLGMIFEERSMFEKAIHQFKLASEGYANLLGPDDDRTIDSLDALKACLQYSDAEKEMSSPMPEDRINVSARRRLSAP